MSDAKEREAFEAELAKVDERIREIERVESELLDNIAHGGFRAASDEARLRSEKETLYDMARKLRNRIAVSKRGG
jgi:predicted  nucleic acid-binding Zn-ribbon protein